MSFDVALMVIVLGGIGLSAAYVRAEYLGWRELGAAERQREAVLQKLHTARLSVRHDAPLPSVLTLEDFSEVEAANPDYVSRTGQGATRTLPQNAYSFPERRKRKRQRATT
jgi:hypothetical protein